MSFSQWIALDSAIAQAGAPPVQPADAAPCLALRRAAPEGCGPGFLALSVVAAVLTVATSVLARMVVDAIVKDAIVKDAIVKDAGVARVL